MTVWLVFWRNRRGEMQLTILKTRKHYEWARQILNDSDGLQFVGEFEVSVP